MGHTVPTSSDPGALDRPSAVEGLPFEDLRPLVFGNRAGPSIRTSMTLFLTTHYPLLGRL